MISLPCCSQRRFAAAARAAATFAGASALACAAVRAEQAAEVRLSRYTTAAATPEPAQVDPLEAVVHLTLPRGNVQTVGDAIAYLLLRTGYRMTPAEATDPQVRAVLAMALPEVHRRLGPYSVRTALSILLGRPFVLSVDPLQRLVTYRPEPAGNANAGPVAKALDEMPSAPAHQPARSIP
jgi:conjugative transfer region protein (TIGR03748 family)